MPLLNPPSPSSVTSPKSFESSFQMRITVDQSDKLEALSMSVPHGKRLASSRPKKGVLDGDWLTGSSSGDSRQGCTQSSALGVVTPGTVGLEDPALSGSLGPRLSIDLDCAEDARLSPMDASAKHNTTRLDFASLNRRRATLAAMCSSRPTLSLEAPRSLSEVTMTSHDAFLSKGPSSPLVSNVVASAKLQLRNVQQSLERIKQFTNSEQDPTVG